MDPRQTTAAAVAPDCGYNSQNRRASRRQPMLALLGLLYVSFSVVNSWWFSVLHTQSATNDLFWFEFNDSVQAWLMAAFNHADEYSPRDLTFLAYAQQAIDASDAIVLRQTKSRELFQNQTSPAMAIAICRKVVPVTLLWLSSYCWVDFNKTWSLAHTPGREKRCYERYRSNGAVYLDAVLRNTNMTEFETLWSGPGGCFTIGIAQTLSQTELGRSFLQDLRSRALLSVESELAY
ncbi:unnamed protein product [Aphanomyces euteiches]